MVRRGHADGGPRDARTKPLARARASQRRCVTKWLRARRDFASCEVAIPLPGELPADAFAATPSRNFIDDHVWAKLKVLGIATAVMVPLLFFTQKPRGSAPGGAH